jgi:ubiquinone/menaquinone biosynthesis C-methylase UbiE
LGCGQGASAWFLAREGFTVVGVDQAPSALVKANIRLANDWLTFHGAVGTFKHLPFRDETFDLVVDIVSVAHNTCNDIWKIYFEIERVLKPGGKFFALFPTNKCSRLPFINYGTVSFLEQIEVERLVVNAFKDVSILKQSYEIASGRSVENWVVTGRRQ